MRPHPMPTLNDTVMEIELVLISVVEGLALQFLAANAFPILSDPAQWQYLPYVIGGLLFIFVFWAQAIEHLLSFIRWPLSIPHTLFYFLAGFLQVLAFSALTNPLLWFFWSTVFSIVVIILYVLDLLLLRRARSELVALPEGEALYANIDKRHQFEMRLVVPAFILFSGLCLVLVWSAPDFFIGKQYHIVLGVLQALFSAYALFDTVRNFHVRGVLISRSRE